MMMSGLYFTDDVPFRHVVITGLVRDRRGKPMHKSSGNVVDPLDLIARYGADATRFGLLRLATGGQDMPLQEEVIESARRFANKIWNASRLVLSLYEGGLPELPSEDVLTLQDRWLLSRLQACLEEVDGALDRYLFSEAAQALYGFFWSEFCDWGLEVAKPRLYDGSEEEKRSTSSVLAWVLERTLRTIHPMMPFVTEEIWQRFGAGGSIMISSWPERHREHRDPKSEVQFTYAMELVTAIRRFRKAHAIRDSMSLAARVYPRPIQREVFQALRPEIERLANVSTLEILDSPGDRTGSARVVADGAQVLIPLAGVLDPELEQARLSKRLDTVEAETARVAAKLSNEKFVANAPAEVVEKERGRLRALEGEAAALGSQLEELG